MRTSITQMYAINEHFMGKMVVGHLLLCFLLFQTIDGADPSTPPKKWLTLSGDRPEVVARGGYSGYFPDSSEGAYSLATDNSIAGTILYCNLHFTKDKLGFCTRYINLENTTNIATFDPKGAKKYTINGIEVRGYFGVDYTYEELIKNVFVRQCIYSRPRIFDDQLIVAPFQVIKLGDRPPNRIWLNVENDMFYRQLNISVEGFLLSEGEELPEFLSSPEIAFLKSIGGKMGKSKTKLIFTIPEELEVEPTTEKKYNDLLKDLAMIKSFASGILVPKDYIWPVADDGYLLPASTLVQDAHKQELLVFAYGFANDVSISHNYSHDPAREYMQFFDNSDFSVDGVLSDFPSTPSAVIGCLNPDKKAPRVLKTLVIARNGASGDYPGGTDLAYNKAIEDGADILECGVQLSKDGVAFCLDRSDLIKPTTAKTVFQDRAINISEIQPLQGIFSFDLTWDEILSLKPQIISPYGGADLDFRNPAYRTSGKFMTVAEFLELSKTKAVPGILLSIQNADYLSEKRKLDIVGATKSALSNVTLDKSQKVLIESDDMAVLAHFKDSNYERVLLMVDEEPPEKVKQEADSVVVLRRSIAVADKESLIANHTKLVDKFHAANLKVYVTNLRNEFRNLAQNYFSDPYAELSDLFDEGVDGFVTDYPRTASIFVRSSCTTKGSPFVIMPLVPGVTMEPEKPEK